MRQIWIYGNSFESSLVAIIVPCQAVLEDWAKATGLEGDFQNLCTNDTVKKYVLSELGAIAKSKKVCWFVDLNWKRFFTSDKDSVLAVVAPTTTDMYDTD